ncbi:MAG TPA: ABC transporter ATP-binding protein [Ilumatobacteraceae bacterium]|nr:ABC transporter ATP-binding protein [Ilumatobacteraceae bacterium]
MTQSIHRTDETDATGGPPAVELDGVSLVFDGSTAEERVLALDSIDMSIPPGQFVAVVGPSGCGKTTILNMLAGLLKPTVGTVKRHGEIVSGPSNDIGYMLARSALAPWRTARKNVELGLEINGVPRRERGERALDLLQRVGLEKFADHHPSQLSQGMRQRVSIARTFAIDPDLWLMDEPFAALDAQTRILVQMQFLELWADTGKTVILVTHDLEEATLLADRVIVIGARPGYIKSDTPIDFERPRHIDELRFDQRFADLEHTIWKELRDELV